MRKSEEDFIANEKKNQFRWLQHIDSDGVQVFDIADIAFDVPLTSKWPLGFKRAKKRPKGIQSCQESQH